MKDELVRAMTKDGFVNAVAVTTTGIVERARQIHKTLPTATASFTFSSQWSLLLPMTKLIWAQRGSSRVMTLYW